MRSYYTNSVFGKVGRVASEEVTIQLFNSKCVPVLLYMHLKLARLVSRI